MSENQTPATQQNQPPAKNPMNAVREFFGSEGVQKKLNNMMGERSKAFTASVIQIVSQSADLQACHPQSIYAAAMTAATLDLPLNQNLGFAYVIAYNSKAGKQAQFQMGYKGFIQLAQRSGLVKTLNATDVRQGEIKGHDRLSDEISFAWEQDQEKRVKLPVIAYVAHIKLTNGFEKSLLMYVPEIRQHGQKYSKSFTKSSGLWNTDFHNMAIKTVVKMLISKFGPMTIENQTMQLALKADQAVITEDGDFNYVDTEPEIIDKESERRGLMLQDAETLEELEKLYSDFGDQLTDDQMEFYLVRKSELTPRTAEEIKLNPIKK